MKKTTKLKAFVLSLMMVMMLPATMFAQNDNFVTDFNNGVRDVEPIEIWTATNGISNYGIGEEVPIGSGLLIVTALGAGYAVAKRRRNNCHKAHTASKALILALVLILGITSCKKNVETINTAASNGVFITLDVDGGNSGSRVIVNPNDPVGYATVTFEAGDVIYVGNNGVYCGYLEYKNSGNFEGTVTPSSEDDYLHFYFMGNKGAKSEPTSVSITDQTEKYPVISYAHSKELYSSSTASYTAKLQNYCSIVKFTTNEIPTATAITVKGMKNTVSVNFGANNAAASTPTLGNNPYTPGNSGTGDITLHAESTTVRWAILLEQSAVNGATVTASGYYNNTCNVPAITNNMYYETGVGITMDPTLPELTSGAITLAGSGATPNAATGKVTLTDAGNVGDVTEIGVCWGTAANPTIANSHAAAAGHTLNTEYTVNMGTLDERTTYYIRGYAKVGDNYYYSANQVSEKTYWLIYDLEDWNEFATVVNNGTDATAKAVQMANISGVTTIVGNSESSPFKGSYNGQGYTISNVNISGSSNPTGLFGTVNSASSVIENVVVASGTVSSTARNVGAVVGELNSGTVRYCANYAEVSSGYNGQARVGGVVGWMRSNGGDNNIVSYCINHGHVYAYEYAGGIVGSFGAGFITYCQNYGLIEATGNHGAGGVAAWQSFKAFNLTNSHNGGNVRVSNGSCGYTGRSHYLICTNHLNNPTNTGVLNYPNNTYLYSLTVTAGNTTYTESSLPQFETGATYVTSNPAGITIGGTTYSYNTPAP